MATSTQKNRSNRSGNKGKGGSNRRRRRRPNQDIYPDDEGSLEVISPEQLEQSKNIMNLTELKTRPAAKLVELGESLGVENMARSRKQDIIFSILKAHAKNGEDIYGDGVLEILQDGFGFLRSSDSSYLAGPDDIYVSPSQIRRFNLRTGDTVSGLIRPPKDGERYFALLKVGQINHDAPENARTKVLFENLTPLFPKRSLGAGAGQWQHRGPDRPHHRHGGADRQRATRTDRLAAEGRQNDVAAEHCIGNLRQQSRSRPDGAAHRRAAGRGDRDGAHRARRSRVSSTFDEPASRHVQVADMVIEKAKRLVEHKRDVVILLDSITRLARAYNTVVPSSGKVLTGGVDANALHRPKRFSAPPATSKRAVA